MYILYMLYWISDCSIGEWGDWERENKKEQRGRLIRKRPILTVPSPKGKQCPPDTETEEVGT